MSLRDVFVIKEVGPFFGDEGAGVLYFSQKTGRVLVAHRSAEVNEPNTWGTWGGKMEKGESPEEAARREAGEEAGKGGKLVPVWTFKHPSGFKFHNFLAIVPNEFNPKQTWETQGHRWVEPGRWPEPMHPGLRALVNRPEFQRALEAAR